MIDVSKQEHYTALSPEPIEVIRAWKLGFNLGNVVKYIGRCELKGDKLLDLRKAKQYLEWEIEELEEELEEREQPKPERYLKRSYVMVKFLKRMSRLGGDVDTYWPKLPYEVSSQDEFEYECRKIALSVGWETIPEPECGWYRTFTDYYSRVE